MVLRTKEEMLEYFGPNHFAVNQGVEIDSVTAEKAVVSLVLRDTQKNSYGQAQGGIIFTMADYAFGVASCALHYGTVTLNGDIRYLRSVSGGKITATATLRMNARKICVYDIVVVDEEGHELATSCITGYKKPDARNDNPPKQG